MSTDIAELEAQLAAARAEVATRDDAPLEGDIDGEGGIHLVVRNEKFECRKVSVTWQMMKFAKEQRKANTPIPSGLDEESEAYAELAEKRNAAGMRMLELLLETAMVLLKPHERDRFESFMDDVSADGLEPNELEGAIGNVIAAAGGEQGKAGQTTASQSSASSTTTNENVRVISFSKGGEKAATTA